MVVQHQSALGSALHISTDNGHKPIRIVQLTDCHLGEDNTATLLDMNTDSSLEHVLDMLDERNDDFDLILVTGDIALHGAREAYSRFQSKLSRFKQPKIWVGGNHDNIEYMREVVGFGTEMSRRVTIGGWQIITLDSVTPGVVGGCLAESELQFLQHCLEQQPDKPALIGLHHHPLPIGCNWLDEQQISNSEQLLSIVRSHHNVKAVCWGHVHQDWDTTAAGVRYLSAPSTCVQFAPNSLDFKLDALQPGVRWLELHADGHVETDIWRLNGVSLHVNLESTGYAQ